MCCFTTLSGTAWGDRSHPSVVDGKARFKTRAVGCARVSGHWAGQKHTLGFFTATLLRSPWITGAGRSVPELGSYSPGNILEVALASVGKSNPLKG